MTQQHIKQLETELWDAADDLSAKNPHKIVEVVHQSPKELLSSIKQNDSEIAQLLTQIESLIDG